MPLSTIYEYQPFPEQSPDELCQFHGQRLSMCGSYTGEHGIDMTKQRLLTVNRPETMKVTKSALASKRLIAIGKVSLS